MKQWSENIERPIGKLPNNQAEKPSNLEQQIDNFKNDKPSYIEYYPLAYFTY